MQRVSPVMITSQWWPPGPQRIPRWLLYQHWGYRQEWWSQRSQFTKHARVGSMTESIEAARRIPTRSERSYHSLDNERMKIGLNIAQPIQIMVPSSILICFAHPASFLEISTRAAFTNWSGFRKSHRFSETLSRLCAYFKLRIKFHSNGVLATSHPIS